MLIMNDIAKHEQLNTQALAIEKTETELKQLIKAAVLLGQRWDAIAKKVVELVDKTAAELETEDLKERTSRGLKIFALVQFQQAKTALVGVNLALMGAVTLYLKDKNSEAAAAIAKGEPTLFSGTYRENAQPLQEFSKEYMKKVSNALEELATATAKEYDSPVSLRNIAEMSVRYNRHLEELEELNAQGVKLVWTSTHANCSERCEKWQGKLYSLDNTYGEIDGIKYQPLSNATDIFYTTKKGRTYKNGIISGFNCRHFLTPYKKGAKPIHIDADTIERERAINKHQRYLERGVRRYKDLALTFKGVDGGAYKRYRTKAIEWNNAYIAFSKKNGVAYYPSRTKIL